MDVQPDGVRVSAVQTGDGRDPNLRADITIAAPADVVVKGDITITVAR
ncbi:MAG: hypothetical protein HY047_13420 [Acidobacteria bacterium]|nr:hypothetical protein [Acidobacteriota bacterium]